MEGASKLNAGGRRTAAQRIAALVDDLGVPVACLYLVHRIATRLGRGRARLVAYALCAQPIGSGKLAVLREDPQTRIGSVTNRDPICSSFPRPEGVVRQRFDDGALCYVAHVKGSFGGYIWISRNHHAEDEVRCRYILASPARSAWDFDVYVEPRLRLGRTLARLWLHVDQALASEGIRWCFSRISLFNPGSLAAHQRLGSVRLGTAVFMVLGPAQLAVLSVAPFVHASWGKNPGPAILLAPPDRGHGITDA